MAEFQFDTQPSPGSNRHAPDNGCPTCHGDRLVVTEQREDGTEEYGTCPDCAPAAAGRAPQPDAWWKQ